MKQEHGSETSRIILFDGICNLCNGLVDFIVRHDPARTFRFIPLQSGKGKELLAAHNISTLETDSIVFIHGDSAMIKSKAVLAILKILGRPWSYMCILRFLPRTLRDWVYDRIAKNRFRIFGKRNSCRLPF